MNYPLIVVLAAWLVWWPYVAFDYYVIDRLWPHWWRRP